jgi:beta-mannanase
MSDRWVPILAAVVGVLGAIGGAYAGGTVANQGQEKRFDRERAATFQDLQIATYSKYLETVDGIEAKVEVGRDGSADYVTLRAAESRVALLASPKLRQAAARLADALSRWTPNKTGEYVRTRNTYIELAQHEIASA